MKRIACAVSGGVDSSVSAYLLKRKGFDVTGVFMRNWDLENEKGVCTSDQDREDAAYVCKHLQIPFIETNFVKDYWFYVFSDLIHRYETGMTPNPDILCNKHIKFGAFIEQVTVKLGFDALATGHYAQNSAGNFLEHIDNQHLGNVKLLMARDKWKDQTLFLSQISQKSLRKTMFPVGDIEKSDVKKIAQSIGLDRIVKKRESIGICFVGKRKFTDFIDEYIEPKPGVFIEIENGKTVGEHKGTHHYTIGQRARVSGLGNSKPLYVVKLNASTQEVFVGEGTNHPALYSSSIYTDSPHWISDDPLQTTNYTPYHCHFKFQHLFKRSECSIRQTCADGREGLEVKVGRPTRALTRGQFASFYDGEECLGSAMITDIGPSLYDLGLSVHVDHEIWEKNHTVKQTA